MSKEDLKAVTDIADDESIYNAADVVTPEGGASKKRKADANKKIDPKADTVKESDDGEEEMEDDEMEDDVEEGKKDMKESFIDLFEGTNLSEEFKERASLVFEAAVNEAATEKSKDVAESLEEEFTNRLTESVDEAMGDIVENLDAYLDYIVNEWMEENAVAIESGTKVNMAESFMNSLKGLFEEHNIEIDENSVDVVESLEAQLSESEETANAIIAKNIELVEEVNALKATKIFEEVCEDLTTSQRERMRVLSEKLDNGDLSSFETDLSTLKESFFKKEAPFIAEEMDEESEILTEDSNTPKRHSEYDSVNAIVAAIDARNKK